jgi:hypothetical protein
MLRPTILAFALVSLAIATSVFAQQDAAEVEQDKDLAPIAKESPQTEPAETTEAEPDVVADTENAKAPLETGPICLLGLHTGIDDADAETAADLVCKELRKNGVSVFSVQRSAEGASAVYRIELRRLGENILIDLVYEAPVGSPHDSRSTQLKNIEEVIVAAPRLAKALVYKRPMEETAQLDTLVGEETRPYDKIFGEFFWGLGVLGVALPTAEIYSGFGFQLKVFYESSEYSIGFDLKGGGADQGDDDAGFFGMSVGARYFFSTANISPFVGGGLGFLLMNVENDSDDYDYYRSYDGMGMSAFLETGIEFLRFHSSRLDLALRIDAPFYALEDEYYEPYDYYSPGSGSERVTREKYVFPVSLGLAYCW